MGKKKVLTEEDMAKRLYIPSEGQVLGQVVQQLGYDRFRVRCQDGVERIVRIRGKLKRRAWTSNPTAETYFGDIQAGRSSFYRTRAISGDDPRALDWLIDLMS